MFVMPSFIDRLRATPVHYHECKRMSGEPHTCDCTASADVEGILALVVQQDHQLDQAARTVLSHVDPDGDYHRPSGEEHQ